MSWDKVHSFISWLEGHWFRLLELAGLVIFGFGGRFGIFIVNFILYLTGSALIITGQILGWKRQSALEEGFFDEKRQLEIELRDMDIKLRFYDEMFAQLDYNEVFDMELEVLSNHTLNLGYTERISLYRYDGVGFIRIGRYSRNPTLCDGSKASYPSDQGCIAKTWRNGFYYIKDLPNPSDKWEEYVECQQEYGLKESDISNLNMLSRCYFGHHVLNLENSRPVGIIMFESTEPDAFKPEELRSLMKNGQSKKLAYLMKAMEPLAPGRLIAHKEGF